MPEGLTGLRIEGFEALGLITKKNQTGRGGHAASGTLTGAPLKIFPRGNLGIERISEKNLLTMVAGGVAHPGGIERAAFREGLRLEEKQTAIFVREKIKKSRERIVGGRVPVGCSCEIRADAGAFH